MATPDPPPQHQGSGGFAQGSVRPGAGLQGRGGELGKSTYGTSEFITLVATILAVLIAAAVSDDFDAPHAWTLVAVLSFGYIVSRGLAKHDPR